MSEDLFIKVELYVLSVVALDEDLLKEGLGKEQVHLDICQEEVDAGEGRCDLSTALDGVHLGEFISLHTAWVQLDLLEAECLVCQSLEHILHC